MDHPPKEQLPFGRLAFARTFCTDWISEHGKMIALALLTLIVLSFSLFQLIGKFSGDKTSVFIEAQKAFSSWTPERVGDLNALRALERPLQAHPELESKFGSHIAQRLLTLEDSKKADRYASAAFKRVHALTSSYYERFSRNTLVISRGQFAQGLEEAKRLKSDLDQDDAFWQGRDKFVRSGAMLYAYNLIRIAALERELGSKEGELKAWEELVNCAGWGQTPPCAKTYDPEAYALLAQNFTQGETSLLDYIQERKRLLK